MTTANATAVTDDPGEQTIVDVWSRTSPKYRKRAILLLILNVLLFVGVGSFAYWLRTGEYFAPAQPNYWTIVADTFMPKGDANLGNFVLFPIRVDEVPLHGVVVGLLLAALVSVPILIAILYRFPCSLPFILIVGLVAVMPWLAINITGACMLASLRPFRFRFRYASALLGLLLVLLYFYGASRQATPPVEHYNPADRLKFLAPWLLATFASCIIMGVVLFLAGVVNYRPGVVAPLLLLCFAVPVLVFEWRVGRPELYYRLLEQRFRDDFGERDARVWYDRVTAEAWARMRGPRPTLEVFREQADLRLALELDTAAEMRNAFAQQRDDFIDECRSFVRKYPDSRHAPNVLYLQGQARDARIDVAAFQDKKVLRVYYDFPTQSPQAQLIWQKVVHNAPDYSISAVARYKLAILEARAGRIARAVKWLDELILHYGPQTHSADAPNGQPHRTVSSALASAPPDASLHILVENVVFEAHRLRSLLLENGNDPHYGVRPLCGALPDEPRQPGLMEIDPHNRNYPGELRALLRAYPRSLLADNVTLRSAMTADTLDERIIHLESCIERYPNGDAQAEAHYQLGIACLDAGMEARGRRSLAQVAKDYPESVWAEPATKRLKTLPPLEVESLP